MPNRVIFAFYASHSLFSAIFLSRLHFNPHIYANNDAAWTVSATLCVNVFFVCTCRQLRNIKTNREKMDILFAFPVAQLFEQKQFRNDIHMQRKIPKLKATKVTAQWNHTDFERDWSEKRSTRPANQLARTHTKERKTNQLSRLFFSLPKTQVQFVCTKSLAEEHLYVELWLNFIIQTIYFNVGGGDGAVIFSFWCFSSSSSSSSFSFFINKSEQKKHSLASLLSVQQQNTVEWSELGAANCSQKALSVCDLNIFALRYTKT